ncbi:hypothetical protein ACFV1U_16860 [Streptomyces microflavus]|uniref:hypothetical protein n=1 Tax=Streptomyces microflavus TaxID=1919 RepID=UPI003695B5DA
MPTSPTPADRPADQLRAAVWVDGDPLMEAMAAAVYEQCEQHPEVSVTIDDPRNIAAVAATVARQLLGTTSTCVCGEPEAPGTNHRADGPCYLAEPTCDCGPPPGGICVHDVSADRLRRAPAAPPAPADRAAVLLERAEEFRATFGEIIVCGTDGDWANVADWTGTGARIPACGSFYPHHTDTRCVLHKGHRGSHRAPWGSRTMAWPYDRRETQPAPDTSAGATDRSRLADDAAAGVQPPTSEAHRPGRCPAMIPGVGRCEQNADHPAPHTPEPAAPAAPEEHPARRRLTPTEHDRAWHAIEGSAGEPGADPDTILNAVLHALRIDAPTPAEEQAARHTTKETTR